MDRILIDARDGDSDARQRLITLLSKDLRRYVDREVGSRVRRYVSGADICQEVFLRVFRTLDSLPEDATIGTFRGRLYRNVRWVIARLAQPAARFEGETAFENGAAGEARARAPETGDVTRQDDLRMLRELVGRLPDNYASVVRLRLDGLDFKEIAVQLSEEEGAVRKRFQRVTNRLQNALSEDE